MTKKQTKTPPAKSTARQTKGQANPVPVRVVRVADARPPDWKDPVGDLVAICADNQKLRGMILAGMPFGAALKVCNLHATTPPPPAPANTATQTERKQDKEKRGKRPDWGREALAMARAFENALPTMLPPEDSPLKGGKLDARGIVGGWKTVREMFDRWANREGAGSPGLRGFPRGADAEEEALRSLFRALKDSTR